VASRRIGRHTAAASRRHLLVLTLAVVLGGAAAPGLEGADVLQARPRQAAALLSRYELQVLDRVNLVRARHGRVPLVSSAALTASAELHSARMVARGFFDHEAPGEAAFWHRIERFYPSAGYDYWAVGENLAYGSPFLEASEAMEEWLASDSHRRNLLWARWREVGIAAVHVQSAPGPFEGDPVTVITLDLGVRSG